MTEQEKREKAEAKKHRRAERAERALSNRKLKNFFLWFFGFLVGIIAVVAALAVSVTMIPIKSWLGLAGQPTEGVVSENVADKSLLDAILKADTYSFGDLPIITSLLKEISEDTGLSNAVKIDFDSSDFNNLKFQYSAEENKDFLSELMKLVKVAPGILGEEISKLDVFKTVEVPAADRPDPSNLPEGFNRNLYYYLKSGTFGEENAVYELCYTEDGQYVEGVNDDTVVYYLSLSEMTLDKLSDVVTDRFKLLPVADVLNCFGATTEDSIVIDVLGTTKLKDIGTLTDSDVLIVDVVNVDDDSKLFSVLTDATGKAKEELTLADLASVSFDNIKITSFLDKDESTEKLFNILTEATGKTTAEEITVNDLSGFDVSVVKLSTVISSSENSVLKLLLEDSSVTIGNIGEKIDALSVNDVFDVECWTKDSALSATGSVYKKTVTDGVATYSLYKGSDLPTTDNDLYYVSKNSSIWLFVLYSHGAIEEGDSGLTVSYTEKNTTFGEAKNGFSVSANELPNSTVRQLIEAGLLDNFAVYEPIYSKVVSDIINEAAAAAGAVS